MAFQLKKRCEATTDVYDRHRRCFFEKGHKGDHENVEGEKWHD